MTLPEDLARDVDRAFPSVIEAHQDLVYGLARRMVGDPRDAEEIAQDALVRAYRALHGMHPSERRTTNLAAWLATITLNLARNRLRDRSRRPETVPQTSALRDRSAGPDELVVADDAAQQLLDELAPRDREAVILVHVLGFAYADVSAITGTPEGTLRSRVSRALARLRTTMTTPGGPA